MKRVLLVEDDPKITKALEEGLAADGYAVTATTSGEDGFFLANAETFDIILLDLMLPGRDGLEILRALRKRAMTTPVMILTAKDTVDDRVLGLDCGADDYLVKPFAFPELVARMRALVRRGVQSESAARLAMADLTMDLIARRVDRGGEQIELTVREFELLEYLLRNQGQIVSREMLGRDVWKEAARATSLDNVIDVHIARLRKKVDTDGKRRLIHTVRGVGFSLRVEDE